jgi:predicted nucleic-acid-binding protein
VNDRVGLDTNVALRWLLRPPGDDRQSDRAGDAVESAEEVHINLVVLAEVVWLADRSMNLGRDAQATLVAGLLENPRVDLAEHDCVAQALAAFTKGGPGFTDHLIAALDRSAGCRTTLTFDRTAARAEGFTLLA